jgi:hypothetical protein
MDPPPRRGGPEGSPTRHRLMSLDPLRERVESFLSALEEERYQIDTAQRRAPRLGSLYRRNERLFSIDRITEVQRALAGSGGVEERQIRALLEFLGRGRALSVAGDPLDRRVEWEVFGSVDVGESRIPNRQIPAALGLSSDPDRRGSVEEAHYVALDDHHYLVEDFLSRHRDGISELGYGSHVDTLQILGSIDLLAIAREGERFLAETRSAYEDLLRWHLPRTTGVEAGGARAGDARRLEAAVEYDSLLAGGNRNRRVLEVVGSAGLDPLAEGRITAEWGLFLTDAAGAVCRTPEVPGHVRLAVSNRSGRPAVVTFLRAYGYALHQAYTDPALPVEQRRLGDESVIMATGALFESLLRNPAFLGSVVEFPRHRIPDYLALSTLIDLLQVRREIGRLLYEIAFYVDRAGGEAYVDILSAATGFRHDQRAAIWAVDGEFTTARRIRGYQLGATLAGVMRDRFDEDWFRNPRGADFLRDLFASGRRYSAPELCVQVSSETLGFGAILESVG